MGLFYSPSSNGFYDDTINSAVPVDVVPITVAAHAALLAYQASGRTITYDADKGKPVALAPPEPLLADRRVLQLAAVRAEAGVRIEALVPLWRQSNDNAALAELAWRDPDSLSSDQVEQLRQARERRAAIDAVRDASNELEVAIGAMTVAELKALDVTQPVHWPTSSPDQV